MLNIVISFLTFVLILISLFMVLVILMQRASSNAGMGSAFGGGVTESAFGAETTNILTRATKWSALAFFIIALVLYLLYMSRETGSRTASQADLPDIAVSEPAALPGAGDAGETPADSTGAAPAAESAPEATDEAPAEETNAPVPAP